MLGYAEYRNFEGVIEQAKVAYKNSGQPLEDHFGEVTDMIAVGKRAKRPAKTILMSRYACYLAIQNADPPKEIVALGETYFAVQTRRQELTDEEQLLEDGRRLLIRNDIRLHNAKLADTAMRAGVVELIDYAILQNHGYRGLYKGPDQRGDLACVCYQCGDNDHGVLTNGFLKVV